LSGELRMEEVTAMVAASTLTHSYNWELFD